MRSVTTKGTTTTSPMGLEKMPSATGSAAHTGCRRAIRARPAMVRASASTKGSWPWARYSAITRAMPQAGQMSSIFHRSRAYT